MRKARGKSGCKHGLPGAQHCLKQHRTAEAENKSIMDVMADENPGNHS